jgi:hypothetical protein
MRYRDEKVVGVFVRFRAPLQRRSGAYVRGTAQLKKINSRAGKGTTGQAWNIQD